MIWGYYMGGYYKRSHGPVLDRIHRDVFIYLVLGVQQIIL